MSNISVYRPSLLSRGVWDELFNNVFQDPSLTRRSTEGYPLTDIYKDDDGNSVIECALAGFSKEQLSIEVKESRITISADSGGQEENSRRLARRSFSRSYVDHTGKLDLTGSSATFENGLLRIVVPQIPNVQPKEISIS